MKRGPGLLAHAGGVLGEERARQFLTALGYVIIASNFRTRSGEIDLVARDRNTTVFVEVKRRASADHGTAAEYVGPSKVRRIISAARTFALKHRLTESPIRFDVVAIDVIDGREQIRHHKGAFDAS